MTMETAIDRPSNSKDSESKGKILLVIGAGGFTHAAPVLEIARVLASRGYVIEFATHQGQQKWVETDEYAFVSRVFPMGEPMTPAQEKEHYLEVQDMDPRLSYRRWLRPKYRLDAFWVSDYAHLRDIVLETKPDMILSDFFVDAARDMQHQMGVPLAMMWPQMPHGMADVSYIPGFPGLQIDALTSEKASLWTRIRAELRLFRTLPAILPYFKAVRNMRRKAGVNYSLPAFNKPEYLMFVNSFWGLETPKDLPPLINAVGPILSDRYPALDEVLEAYFEKHKRVVYISFGTHIRLRPEDLAKTLDTLSHLFREGLIDGIIWAAREDQREVFDRSKSLSLSSSSKEGEKEEVVLVGDLLDNRHPAWHFTPFAPQRAILERPETALFFTHGGGSSVNECMFHGTPMLVLGFFFDQTLNGLRVTEAGVGLDLDKAAYSLGEMVAKAGAILRDADGAFAKDVKRMKGIAGVSSRKKEYAADLMEEMIYDVRYSVEPLERETKKMVRWRRRRPMHLETADMRMSIWRAQNWDLRFLGVGTLAAVIGLGYFGFQRYVTR